MKQAQIKIEKIFLYQSILIYTPLVSRLNFRAQQIYFFECYQMQTKFVQSKALIISFDIDKGTNLSKIPQTPLFWKPQLLIIHVRNQYMIVLNSMKIIPATLILMMYPECLSPYSPMAGRQAIRKDFFIHSHTDSIHVHYSFYPKPIGKGAYGTVYLAKMKEPPFADRVVKVIQKRLVKNPQSLKNEVDILRTLDHPNIAKLYQTFEDKSCLYLVQDYCEGGQLFDYLDQIGKLSQQKARQLFTQMVKVIRCLHLQNIAHRDLKAQNFLFAKNDHQKLVLIDFGLAYQWKNDMENQLIEIGQNKILGTPYYIAPEVLAKKYDQRCDIWSLGVILHIISTAAAPFNGKSDSQIISSIRQNKFNRTLQFEQLSPNLKDLIQKMLTVREDRLSLEQILNHPWMKNQQQEEIPKLTLNYSKLRQFAASSRLKNVCLSFIAAQMPSRDNQQIGELFNQMNISGSGQLSVAQIQRQLKSQGLDIDSSQLHKVLKVVDMDKNGRINFNQFVASSLHSSYCTRSQYLLHIFSHFDLDHNGKISAAELTEQIGKMGLQLPTRLVRQIMQEADLDNDGFITYEQFAQTLTHV